VFGCVCVCERLDTVAETSPTAVLLPCFHFVNRVNYEFWETAERRENPRRQH
jgi:hypothetical protein